MIYAKGIEVKISGNMLLTVGAELTQVIGVIYDMIEKDVGKKAAEDFIDMCVNSALERNLPEEVKKEIDETVDQVIDLGLEEAVKILAPDLIL